MEGYLELWENGLAWGKWKRRYFILTDNILSYCKKVEGEVQGKVHLKVATLDCSEDNPTCFKLYSGVSELQLKAESSESKLRWVKAIKTAQNSSSSDERMVVALKNVLQMTEKKSGIDEQLKYLLNEDNENDLHNVVAKIFNQQAIFASQLSGLKSKASPEQTNKIEELLETSNQLKKFFSQSLNIINEEKDKLLAVREVFKKKMNTVPNKGVEKDMRSHLEEILEEKSSNRGTNVILVDKDDKNLDESKFFSVIEDPEEFERVKNSFFLPLAITERRSFKKTDRANSLVLEKNGEPHPMIKRLIAENPVFREFGVDPDDPIVRTVMPVARTEVKVNVWALLKDNIGKDLSRITMPIYLNDPMSMLQKAAEILEFVEFYRVANKCPDEYLRMAHVVAATYALIIYSVNRLKKPFNPLLGETYEYIQDDLRFISEQVSHHPPVSAFYCESDDFVFEGSLNTKTSISLAGFEVTPKGPFKVTLKKTKETFSLVRSKTMLHNFIIGKMYLWHSGEMTVTNEATGARLVLLLKPKGWSSRHDYEAEGKITNGDGQTFYHLYGKWNEHLTAINAQTKVETRIVARQPDAPDAESQYFFTQFQRNLNHLPAELLPRLPPSDSRLRPDQRSYEYGKLDLATAEKNRLEEKQRAARKLLEKSGAEWHPVWFDLRTQPNGEMDIRYLGKYFEARQARKWPPTVPDLFNN